MEGVRPALPEDARQALRRVGRADLLIGIPSYQNARTIRHVVEAAAQGARRAFPGLRTVILNADGSSTDGTPQAALSARVPAGTTVLSTPYEGPPGKGSAVRAVFEAAVLLNARACATLDADLRSIAPWWVERLAGPVIRGEAEYVAPYYVRHKYDGTITNHLAYPMTRALYGVRVRQPIGGDFAFSGAFAAHALRAPGWGGDVARFGIDIWMTTVALNEGYRVVQAYLGTKIHDPRDPAAHLGPMFRQVVGTLFSLMETYADRWRHVERSVPAPFVGEPVEAEPEPVPVDRTALMEGFRDGFPRFAGVWREVLDPETFAALAPLADRPDGPDLPGPLWARICYAFAGAFHGKRAEALLEAMVPLYFGRVAAFVRETEAMTTPQAEAVVERQAEAFESQKPYLLAVWDRR
ncbi:MAG: glycosyltransferase [Armatimonadota bacterium]|nr:glycosyltransferase [Armatimonadota bacterium]MDR7443684.1 glycosyltransferase [Armatimonadota bacterium]MDR7570379.1 glycosyltransferase [Armatimonadota bacterium]MDR7613788.1 glycosyltransferase [Armatimonadota bacterium]